MKNTDTIISLNRLDNALAKHGVKLKRNQLVQVAASAYGLRNVHELAAADAAGDLAPPRARYMGRAVVSHIGWMHFFQDPDGVVFAVDQKAVDEQEKRASKWLLSPLGGLLDVSELTEDDAPVAQQSVGVDDARQPDNRVRDVVDGAFRAPAGVDLTHVDKGEAARFAAAKRGDLVYMTNAVCEIAAVTQADLYVLQLPWGEFDGEFYPLTREENEFIADDVVVSADGLRRALMGYSVLYKGRKHVLPTIEVPIPKDRSRDEVMAEVRAYADRIVSIIDRHNGEIIIDESTPDRICLGLAIPMPLPFANYEEWTEIVSRMMVDPLIPTVQDGRYPIRSEAGEIAVEVSWIGEGFEGDYNPEDEFDHPLLRFDTQRLVDGRWIDVEDGSYCTQVHAYCSIETARALARYLVDRIEAEGGKHPKRLLESLSWTDIRRVEEDMEARRSAMDAGAEEYVAHSTYGDPENGTSIDLRRRRDGSVRCEVYVDLNAADVFEGVDMAEVRRHLRTMPCDMERADGDPLPSYALAPQWDTIDPKSVRWMLVPESEDEKGWFADHANNAPFAPSFVRIDAMTV